MLYIDFETRSRTDIEYGAWKYSLCPSTDILCFAWAIDDGPVNIWKPGMPFPQWATDEQYFKEHCKVVEAHNASFEQAIWKNVCIPRYNWIYVPPIKWVDSMAQCAAAAIPLSLQNACIAMDTPKKKDTEGKLVMQQLSKPRKPTAKNKKEWHEIEDYPEKYNTLFSYCIDDVEAERSLSKSLPPLIERERWVWVLDQIINQRGIKIDIPLVEKSLKLIEEHKRQGLARMAEITAGEVTTTQQVAKLKEWLSQKGVPLLDLQKNTIDQAVKRDDLPADVLEVLKIRQSLSKSSTAKLDKMLGCADKEGKVRYALLYHGASTGRWAGRLIQVQNFPRGAAHIKDIDTAIDDLRDLDLDSLTNKYGDVMDLISTCLRGMIISSPGHDFVSADFNAIEARVVMWLAEQDDAIQAYIKNEDNYIKMAAYLYGKPESEVTKSERQMGKQVILGCGFGMGADKFMATCLGYGMEVDVDLAQKAVKAYREKYSNVPIMWKNYENAAIDAVITGSPQYTNKVTWSYDRKRDFLYCILPSGRKLSYMSPRIQQRDMTFFDKKTNKMKTVKKPSLTYLTVSSVGNQWVRNHTYGGHLTENIAQAVARDCLVEGLFRIERKKYLTIMTVHDEIVAEVPEGKGSVEEFEALLSISPDWAPDLPIKAEGWRGKRYRK